MERDERIRMLVQEERGISSTRQTAICAELMNPDRPSWKDAGHPSPSEKASAFDGFTTYCGRYEIDETQVSSEESRGGARTRLEETC